MQADASASLAEPFLAEPPCAVCGRAASRVELVPPGPGDQRWRLVFRGIERGNGHGDAISDGRAAAIRAAFATPYRYALVHTAGFYDDAGFCAVCDAAYCYTHWNPSSTGYGRCPSGHGKSLDPHWWPDDD